jgi:hypothetical protein
LYSKPVIPCLVNFTLMDSSIRQDCWRTSFSYVPKVSNGVYHTRLELSVELRFYGSLVRGGLNCI